MADLIIFGTNDTAQLAHYYLCEDSEHRVIAFTVHRNYIEESEFCGLPVIPFEDIKKKYSNDEVKMFAPMTAQNMNEQRKNIYLKIKEAGFELISYISTQASVHSTNIGENCFILEDNTIQPFVEIGNNVVLWSGNHIGHHSKIDNHAFISSHAVISGHCHVQEQVFIGVNATLRDGITLKPGTFIGMGACVHKSTEPWSAYIGSPAKKMAKSSRDINIYHNQSNQK